MNKTNNHNEHINAIKAQHGTLSLNEINNENA